MNAKAEQVNSDNGQDKHLRRLLVLDTDPGVRWALEKGLGRSGYEVQAVADAETALRIANGEQIDAIIMELLPEAGLSFETLSSLVEAPYAPKIVCISVDSSPQTVIDCMRRGAADFLVKPFSLAELRGAIARALDRGDQAASRQGPAGPDDQQSTASYLIGVSPAIQELRKVVHQAAKTDLNCLIRGDSGVGKDLVAREIHRLSRRRDKPFVKVNCSALPENLLESELFGYEKGAFTGADTSKPGRFTLAHQGIIFLDEIGDMHPYVQAKILQVIEHKEFTKLGGGNPVKVDVQIIAATNANLEEKIATGAFRDDLYFRLNEVYIWVPPLSERREDVPLLVRHFLRKHQHYGTSRPPEITGEDLEALSKYDWPGNVRELESTIKRWLALGTATFGKAVQPHAAGQQPGPTEGESSESDEKKSEKKEPPSPDLVLKALEEQKWNRRKAAEELGISYSAIRRYIDKYDLDKR